MDSENAFANQKIFMMVKCQAIVGSRSLLALSYSKIYILFFPANRHSKIPAVFCDYYLPYCASGCESSTTVLSVVSLSSL